MLVGGIVIVLVGSIMTLFGTVYSTTIVVGREYGCGQGCHGGSSQDITTSYYLYPIWGLPLRNNVDYGGTSCNIQSWYTPFNPPPSCIPPPVSSSSPNYIPNLIGVVLILLGTVVMVRAYADESTLHRSTANSKIDHPQT